jgi:hypothetical protein
MLHMQCKLAGKKQHRAKKQNEAKTETARTSALAPIANVHISPQTAAASTMAAMATLCARFPPGDVFGNILCCWFFVIATLYIREGLK